MTKLSDLTPLRIRCVPAGMKPDDFLEECPVCGQTIDLWHLEELLWHAAPGHEPLELDS
nr:hypothetical protein P9270_029755 [Mesorhizobium sp. WSM4875]